MAYLAARKGMLRTLVYSCNNHDEVWAAGIEMQTTLLKHQTHVQ